MDAIWLWPAIIISSSIGVTWTTFANLDSPIRPVIALWFFVICPGMALVRLLHLKERLTELTLAVALSLAIDALVAAGMLYAGLWSPPGILLVLVAISISGAIIQIIIGYRRRDRIAVTTL